MRRTSAALLVGAGVVGVVLGFGLDMMLTAMARPTLTPDIVLPIFLVVLAIAVVLLAWPIRRARNNPRAPRVNPFRAVRVAVLARASSIIGAGVGGFAGGLLLFVLTRQVLPQVGSIAVIASSLAAGVLLVVGALIAESFCTLPKDHDDDFNGPDDPTAATPS